MELYFNINSFHDSHWIWFINENSSIEEILDIKGKYLFFCDDKQKLVDLGQKLLLQYSLPLSKVPLNDTPKNNVGFGFVLCVYSKDSSLKQELTIFENIGVNYRYWKSDEDTNFGKYSQEYLNNKT